MLLLARTIYMATTHTEDEQPSLEELVWHAQGCVTPARALPAPTRSANGGQWLGPSARFARAYEQMSDDPQVKSLRRDVERYQADLDALRVSDSQIHRFSRGPGSTVSVTLDLLRASWNLLKALPLLLPGVALHFPILLLARIVARREVYTEVHPLCAHTRIPTSTGGRARSPPAPVRPPAHPSACPLTPARTLAPALTPARE